MKNKLFDLPFDDVIKLYQQKEFADKTNDIKLRTQLLKNHPELFDHKIMAEVTETVKRVALLNSNRG